MKTPTRALGVWVIGSASRAARWHRPTASADSASNTSAVTLGLRSCVSGVPSSGGGGVPIVVTPPGSLSATSMPMPSPRETRVNEPIFCGVPSSRSSKSAAVRSVTGRPLPSRTTTSTRMAVV